MGMKYRVTVFIKDDNRFWYLSNFEARNCITVDKSEAQKFDKEQALSVTRLLKDLNINAGTEQAGNA